MAKMTNPANKLVAILPKATIIVSLARKSKFVSMTKKISCLFVFSYLFSYLFFFFDNMNLLSLIKRLKFMFKMVSTTLNIHVIQNNNSDKTFLPFSIANASGFKLNC